MHPALNIPEILLDILHHYCPLDLCEEHRIKVLPGLAALATTCRTFKEPALDILWEVLVDLSPLVRCLPDASQRTSGKRDIFSFKERLTSDDWDIIRSYTRRIRSVHHFTRGLDRKAIRTLSTPPTTEPLFPNLRVLRYDHADRYTPLLHLPLLSLVSLSVNFTSSQLADNLSLPVPLPKFCPDIRTLSIHVVPAYKTMLNETYSSHICRWRNLQSIACPQLALDVNALIHLSCMSALTTLHLGLSNTSSPPSSALSFSSLQELMLNSVSLNAASQLLSHTRLPVIITLTITCIRERPSRQDISSFFSCLGSSTSGRTIETFSLTQPFRSLDFNRLSDPLGLGDLRPCLAFCNLRHMEFNIECNVCLTDTDALTLASAWPQLQHLLINVGWGWGHNVRGGVTPDGLVRVLQACPSLNQIAVVLDTRGYTTLSPDHAPERLGLTLPPMSINILDSPISAECVGAVAAFLSSVAAGSGLSLVYWDGWGMDTFEMPVALEWLQLWDGVRERIVGTTLPGDGHPEFNPLSN